MKKLSLLIALMCVITISGVYATWSYAGTNDIADAFAEAKVTITDAVLTGANGTYKIESNLVLSIDQKDSGDHTAVLLYSGNDNQEPYIRVTFTPAENAPQNIKEDAVPSELYFCYSGDTVMHYKMDPEGNYDANGTPKDIFVLTPMANKVLDVNITWPDEPTGGAFVVTYGLAEIKEFINLNGTFVLDTKAEHYAFRTALSGNIVARITDGTVTGGTAST